MKSNYSFKLTFLKKKLHLPVYYKHICEGGAGVKIDYVRPRSAECDGKSVKCQCGGMVQDKRLQLIYFNKRKHPMLIL